MKIILEINGEDKTFVSGDIKARMFRKAMTLNKKLDFQNLDVDGIDELVGFVCSVFRDQFTIDEFYDGLDNDKFMSTITDAMNTVSGSVSEGNAATEKK